MQKEESEMIRMDGESSYEEMQAMPFSLEQIWLENQTNIHKIVHSRNKLIVIGSGQANQCASLHDT